MSIATAPAPLPWSNTAPPDVEFTDVPFDGYVAHKHPHVEGYVLYMRDRDMDYMLDERFDFWWRMLDEIGRRINA